MKHLASFKIKNSFKFSMSFHSHTVTLKKKKKNVSPENIR